MGARPTSEAEINLATLRDAVHFASTQPSEGVNTDLLLEAMVRIYLATGLTQPEAMLLISESQHRWADRMTAIVQEAINGLGG